MASVSEKPDQWKCLISHPLPRGIFFSNLVAISTYLLNIIFYLCDGKESSRECIKRFETAQVKMIKEKLLQVKWNNPRKFNFTIMLSRGKITIDYSNHRYEENSLFSSKTLLKNGEEFYLGILGAATSAKANLYTINVKIETEKTRQQFNWHSRFRQLNPALSRFGQFI